jgi:hypothetical protein
MGVRTKITYTKELKAAVASVRYYAFRTREVEQDRVGIFDRSSNHADVNRFIRSLDDPLTREQPGQPPRIPKMHRMLFTMSGQEFKRWELTSWQPIIRETMENFQRRHGIKLEWVAAEHPSPRHPHCHVAIKSVYEDQDGNRHRLRITPEMRKEIWQEAQAIVDRSKDRVLALDREERASSRLVHGYINEITKATRQAQQQHEAERQLQRDRDFRGR